MFGLLQKLYDHFTVSRSMRDERPGDGWDGDRTDGAGDPREGRWS